MLEKVEHPLIQVFKPNETNQKLLSMVERSRCYEAHEGEEVMIVICEITLEEQGIFFGKLVVNDLEKFKQMRLSQTGIIIAWMT